VERENLAAATHDGLDEHGVLDLLGLGHQVVHVLLLSVVAGNDRHGGVAHDLLRLTVWCYH
jgi:hypothetical protein